jgi:hypothetical protein
MTRRGLCLLVVALLGLLVPGTIRAQDAAKEALASFSPQTIRLEYSNLAKLRTLPNYDSLRQRYVGPRLKELEDSLSQLGVQEADVDEIVLGWQPGSEKMELDGLVAGRFNPQTLADRAAAQGLSSSTVDGAPVYCLGSESTATCVAVLNDSLGAFGSLHNLGTILETRSGAAASLMSNERVVKLVGEVQGRAPIWGVNVGEAVPDWFKAWLPAQANLQMDWARTFQSVEALVYSVDTADKVQLDAKLDCTTAQTAESLRQILEGLKIFQQLAWQNQNPNQPNPFESVEIVRNEQRVSLKMTTGYAELTSPGAPTAH